MTKVAIGELALNHPDAYRGSNKNSLINTSEA
jgi:hypothetical protein